MKKISEKISIFGITVFAVGVFFASPVFTFAATNLIANPDVEILNASSSIPTDWHTAGYGVSTSTFSYILSSDIGEGSALQVTISSYVDGDAKWSFTPVPVIAGMDYKYTDKYSATIPTQIVAEFFDVNHGHLSYVSLVSVPAGSAQTSIAKFSAPTGSAYVTIFHLIAGNGSLTTDSFSLTELPPAPAFGNGVVSITFDDGWRSQYKYAYPILKNAGLRASYYFITNTLPGNESRVNVMCDDGVHPYCNGAVISSNSTSWTAASQFPDPTQATYVFSESYTADSLSTVTVSYTHPNGTPIPDQQNIVIGTLSATPTLQQSDITFTIPESVMALIGTSTSPSFTISQKVADGQVQTVSNPGLYELESPEDTYMNTVEMLDLQANGNEISVHTKDHCDLAKIDIDPSLALTTGCASPLSSASTATEQISGSRSAILGYGIFPADTFVYPYGSFNAHVEQIAQQAGFIAARSVLPGFNTKDTDRYALATQLLDKNLTLSPTALATAQGWIDEAIASKKWLILTVHGVFPQIVWDQNVAITPTSVNDATTQEFFQEVVNYLKFKNVCVATMHDAFVALDNSTDPCSGVVVPPPVNQAPAIASHVNISLQTTSATGTIVTYVLPAVTDDADTLTAICAPASGSLFAIGTTTVACNATDTHGLSAAQTTFDVGVALTAIPDTTVPVITLNGDVTINLTTADTYTESGATATDDRDGNITSHIVITGNVNTSVVGTYQINYNVADNAGNNAVQVTRTVNVTAVPVVPTSPVAAPRGGGGSSSGSSRGRVPVIVVPPKGQVLGANIFIFTLNLQLGSTGNEVTELQKRLTVEGVYSGPVTGYFGPLTSTAVKVYQTKFGIEAIGFVGPKTRTKLNEGSTAQSATKPMTHEEIVAMITKLQAELALLLKK